METDLAFEQKKGEADLAFEQNRRVVELRKAELAALESKYNGWLILRWPIVKLIQSAVAPPLK